MSSVRAGSFTMQHPRRVPFARRVKSFGRVKDGRPPKGMHQLGEMDGMSSDINMAGIRVVQFVVSVVSSDVINVQTRGE